MNRQEFKKAISMDLNAAKDCSRKWKGYPKHPEQLNAYRSAYFCYQAGEHLDGSIARRFPGKQLERRQIEFDDNDEKTPGEWLLDILWCDTVLPDPRSKSELPSKIYVALECESSTSGKGFFEDFAKLVHVNSDIKIFAAGVDQIREPVMSRHVEKRKREAAQFLTNWAQDLDNEEWYLAFWPSPKDGRRDVLDSYPHLDKVRVFELRNKEFVPI